MNQIKMDIIACKRFINGGDELPECHVQEVHVPTLEQNKAFVV